MKKFLRRASFLMLALAMVMSMAVGIYADDDAARITFRGFGASDGFEFTSNGTKYTDTDLFGSFKNVMPGDTLTQKVVFENKATDTDYVVLYLRAEPHGEGNPLSAAVAEKETLESMNDFLSKLTMTITCNGTQIYNAAPHTAGQLSDLTALGTVYSGGTLELEVELNVPIELDNTYANRFGEVDWVFYVEGFNVKDLTVRKVWNDGAAAINHSDDQVEYNLLQNGQVYSTRILNAANNWTETYYDLDADYEWTVEELNVPEGYSVSYELSGTTLTIVNTREQAVTDFTVRKVWENHGNAQPDSVTVELLANGLLHDTVTLSAANNWQYRWTELSADLAWSVRETDVPAGYTAQYAVGEAGTVITNVYHAQPATTQLTAEKVWSGEGTHPDSATVALLADGEVWEMVTLSADNDWTHTWTGLDAAKSWSVVEQDIPAGYTASYETAEQTVIITNTAVPTEPVSLTAKKVWSGDKGVNRPTSVTATLYNGTEAVESVLLNAANDWTYTWTELDPTGSWQILETNIPKQYTPSYAVENGVVTITNTATLIHTGQLKWPIPVLGGLGIVLAVLGCVVIFKKKKDTNA